MPATLIHDPLSVMFELPNGVTFTVDLDGLPNEKLAADMALGLQQCAHPTGGITSLNAARHYAWILRKFVRSLAEGGFTGGAAGLRRTHLIQHWLALPWIHEMNGRMMLRAFDVVEQALAPEVRDLLDGKMLQSRPKTTPYRSYTDTEWARLIDRCEQVVTTARREQLALVRASGVGAGLGSNPSLILGEITEADLVRAMSDKGPMTATGFAEHIGMQRQRLYRAKLTAQINEVREKLFPTPLVAFAYQLLLGVYSGIVPDGISGLGIDDLDWAGDNQVLLSYVKGRSGPQSLHLPKRAGRLLERWLEHSASLRALAPDHLRGQLWLVTPNLNYGTELIAPLSKREGTLAGLVERLGVLGDDGEPLEIHRSRIRSTYQSLLARRGWTGRTTIDPNHTAKVEGDHYLKAATPAEVDAVESIIEDAQADLLRKTRPPVILPADQAAELADNYPELISQLDLGDTVLSELLGGQRDVFTAACTDQLAGTHGPKGKPCPARPWVCLLCPLAVFLPRHEPNLLRLKAFVARQYRQMTTNQFLRVFGPYADRLDTQILPKLTELREKRGEPAPVIADSDAELPLRPEEGTQ